MKTTTKVGVIALCTSLFLGLAVFGVNITFVTKPQAVSAITSGTTACSQSTSPLKSLAGLNSITITEKTGINNTPTYNPTSSSLNFGTSDLNTTASEHYDFYYSDADGTANPNGAYISSKMHRDVSMANAQSGNNIDSLKLTFNTGNPVYADLIASYQLGASVSSVSSAALPQGLGSPDGVVTTAGDQDSRVTFGFCAAFNTTTYQCSDGLDNDNDQATDYPNDFSCSSTTDNDETNPMAACQDGTDNDGDSLTDYPQDPGCTSKQDNSETNGTIACSSNSQCPASVLTGSATCSGNSVYQNRRSYVCDNPGTTNSACRAVDNNEFQNNCASNQTCSGAGVCTTTSNLTVSCYTNPNPVQTNQSMTFISNASGGTGNYVYSWAGACVGSSQNCSNSFGSSSTYTASLNVVSGSQSASANCSVIVNQQTTSANMTATVQVRNLSAGNLNWSNSVAAAPSDILQFNVVVRSNGNSVANNVTVRDMLPANLYYNNFLTIDGVSNSGSITGGVNIGNLSYNQAKTLVYQVQVAPSPNFAFGATSLVNAVTATSTDSYNNTATGNASVVVTKSSVAGATDVSTGLTDNIFIDSFFIPLMLALLGVWAWKSGLLNSFGFAGWVSAKKANFRDMAISRELDNKISQIKNRENQ